IILFSVIIGALEYTLSETESSIMGGVLFVLIAITSILYGIGHYQKLQLIKISKASRQETLKRVKQKKGYIQADNKTVLVAETSTKTTKKPTKTADKPIKESPVKATQKKSSAKKYILWGCLSISIVGIIIISMFAIGVYFATTEDGESTISVAEATDEYYENDEYNNVNDVVETPYDDVYNENDVVETPYEDEYYVETVSLLDFIVGNGFSELVLSQNSSSGVDNDLFSINIKAGKFRINVRNTYDLPNSYVLTQVSENEFFTVSKKITLISELLTLNNDLTTNPIAVDGQTGQFDPVTFSKGMKLDNIYETENYSFDIYGDYGANRGSSYLADLLINVGQPDEIKYTIAINKSSVNRKQNSNWYYLNELNGWILSDFCDVNQLTDNSMAIIDDSDGWSNVREAQTTKSSILFKIFDNEKFTIITNFGKWSLIEFNGDRGYISNSVIKLLE
ncbi:SH3 domain-containing protein, partial [Flavobacteriaceae bacterium]|nr:SH3 domain-containing protein [Flavobacteriaceae bacterium]